MHAFSKAVLSFAAAATIGAAGHAAAGTPDALGFVRVTPSELTWVSIPGAKGAQAAFVLGDPSKPGVYVLRAKFPPYVMDTPHTHSGGDRYVTVIEGQWCTGTGSAFDPAKAVRLGPGSVMKHPSGAVHWDGSCTDAPVIVQIVGEGVADTKPVDPKKPAWVDVTAAMAGGR